MRKLVTGILVMWGATFAAQASPDTSGSFAIGGQSSWVLSSPTMTEITTVSPAETASKDKGLFSLRYGLSPELNITGFVGLEGLYISAEKPQGTLQSETFIEESKTRVDIGAQIDYFFAQFENSRLAIGLAVFVEGIGAHHFKSGSKTDSSKNLTLPLAISLAPSLSYEYFILPRLSVSGSFSLPLTFSVVSDTSIFQLDAKILSLVTTFRPVAGVHYYF